MAGRTTAELTDLLDVLRLEHVQLRAQVDTQRVEFDKVGFIQIRDRLARIESLLELAHFGELIGKIATLEEQTAELKKWKDERDRRNWQFWLGIGMCVFTFTANIVIQLVMFFARKPF